MVRSVPLVLTSDDGSLSVCKEGLEVLESLDPEKGVAVVAVAGLYRTGKSYLLNHLVGTYGDDTASVAPSGKSSATASAVAVAAAEAQIDTKSTGFSVGNTVNACTKGIWLYGEPLILEDGSSVLFL